jgi:prephenate dehydrogenase
MFSPKSVAIVGGSGQMGQWFAKLFREHGAQVTLYGRNKAKCAGIAKKLGVHSGSIGQGLSKAQLVMIAVSPQSFGNVAENIGPYIRPGQRVIDITSVKEMPVKAMHRHMGKAITLGTHPMFGPLASPQGQNFILTPTSAAERGFALELEPYLRRMGFTVVLMGPKKHDAAIGSMLSLTHFIGFVTADTWRELGMHSILPASSTSFTYLKSFVNSIVGSSPELYSYLQIHVKHAYVSESVFVRKSKEWAAMVKGRREGRLRSRMAGLRGYMGKLD